MPPSTLTKIATMQKDIGFIKEYLEKDEKWKSYLMNRLETNYAGKWVEKILIFVWTWVWIAIIGAVMALILKS